MNNSITQYLRKHEKKGVGMASQGKGARNKGANFERDIAKTISKWVYGEIGHFHRTPMSGGLHWSANARSAGDIVPDDLSFPFVIECKAQESWNLLQLYNRKGTLWNFIEQAESEGKEAKKPWLLIFKKNHVKPKVIYNLTEFYNLIDKQLISVNLLESYGKFVNFHNEYILTELSDFIGYVKVLNMKEIEND